MSPGDKYGNWTIVERLPNRQPYSVIQYLCRCTCGAESEIVKVQIQAARVKDNPRCSKCVGIQFDIDGIGKGNMSELAKRHGLSRHTVHRRLKSGWKPEVAFTRALKKGHGDRARTIDEIFSNQF